MPTYEVFTQGGGKRLITADAVRVEHGTLIFTTKGALTYALCAATWAACERKDTDQE